MTWRALQRQHCRDNTAGTALQGWRCKSGWQSKTVVRTWQSKSGAVDLALYGGWCSRIDSRKVDETQGAPHTAELRAASRSRSEESLPPVSMCLYLSLCLSISLSLSVSLSLSPSLPLSVSVSLCLSVSVYFLSVSPQAKSLSPLTSSFFFFLSLSLQLSLSFSPLPPSPLPLSLSPSLSRLRHSDDLSLRVDTNPSSQACGTTQNLFLRAWVLLHDPTRNVRQPSTFIFPQPPQKHTQGTSVKIIKEFRRW